MDARTARIAAVVAMSGCVLAFAGCLDRSSVSRPSSGSGTDKPSGPDTPMTAGSATPSRSVTDPWTPVPVRGVSALPQRLTADPRGDLFVPLGSSGRLYRVLHAGASPAPVERVQVSLQAVTGFSGGFLAYAGRLRQGRPVQRHWLVVDRRGGIRPVPETLGTSSPLRPGDVVYRSPLRDQTFGFRPTTGARFPFDVPVPHRLWERDERGWLWSCPYGGSTGTIWWSSDGARSWHETRYRLQAAAQPSSRWTSYCLVRGHRLALIAFLDDNPAGFISWPLDGSPAESGELTPFGPLLNPYAGALLADGRLVFGTHRKGLEIESTPGSGRFTFAPGPLRLTSDPDPTSDGLAWTQGRWIYTTTDGRHWNRIDPLAGR